MTGQISEDGMYMWDGANWVANPNAPGAQNAGAAQAMAADASQLYAKNVYNFLTHLYKDDNKLNLDDEITSGSMLLNNGSVCNETVKQFLDKG